jgi:hypothetical protein
LNMINLQISSAVKALVVTIGYLYNLPDRAAVCIDLDQ